MKHHKTAGPYTDRPWGLQKRKNKAGTKGNRKAKDMPTFSNLRISSEVRRAWTVNQTLIAIVNTCTVSGRKGSVTEVDVPQMDPPSRTIVSKSLVFDRMLMFAQKIEDSIPSYKQNIQMHLLSQWQKRVDWMVFSVLDRKCNSSWWTMFQIVRDMLISVSKCHTVSIAVLWKVPVVRPWRSFIAINALPSQWDTLVSNGFVK